MASREEAVRGLIEAGIPEGLANEILDELPREAIASNSPDMVVRVAMDVAEQRFSTEIATARAQGGPSPVPVATALVPPGSPGQVSPDLAARLTEQGSGQFSTDGEGGSGLGSFIRDITGPDEFESVDDLKVFLKSRLLTPDDALATQTLTGETVLPWEVKPIYSEAAVDEWLEANTTQIQGWVGNGVPALQMLQSIQDGIRENGMELAAQAFEEGGVTDESMGFVVQILTQYGYNPSQAGQLAEQTGNELLLYDDDALNARAKSYNFADAESWLNFIRSEFADSSSPELRRLGESDAQQLLWTIDNGFPNIGDQEEALRVSQRIMPFTPEGYGFSYDGGNGFVFGADWNKVSGSLGLDPDSPQSKRLTELIFSNTAAIFGSDTSSVAPYIALMAKKSGAIEQFIGREEDPMTAARRAFAIQAGQAGIQGITISNDAQFEGVTTALAGQFSAAVERYGRPELALIAVDNPQLAERIYNNGSPSTEEERDQVLTILEQYDANDLAAIGFGSGWSARYVDELTTVGGAAGASLRASGATTVQQQDPEALAESYRQTYKSLLLEDPSEAEVQAFVGSIQSANRAAVSAVTDTITSGFNVWTGTSYGSDEISKIVEQYDVNPAARQLAQIKGSSQYEALYRHLPTGVSEEEFVNRYRAKVGGLVGAEDVSDNLDAVRYGMTSGDASAAGRIAYGSGATKDETVRSDIASKVRFIRGLV